MLDKILVAPHRLSIFKMCRCCGCISLEMSLYPQTDGARAVLDCGKIDMETHTVSPKGNGLCKDEASSMCMCMKRA